MKTKEVIIEQQKDFIQEMKDKTISFINSIDKSEIETILLSGSVSRGDYFPQKKENGEYNGMVDLIVMRKNGSSITAEDIFGANQEPEIPFHCIKFDGIWFEILFTDFIDTDMFSKFEEPRKFSVLESQILYDPNNSYKNELEKINQFAKEDLENNLNGSLGYIHYLISDYKKDRWYRRDAFIQLHEKFEHSNKSRNTGLVLSEWILFSGRRQGNLLFPQLTKNSRKLCRSNFKSLQSKNRFRRRLFQARENLFGKYSRFY